MRGAMRGNAAIESQQPILFKIVKLFSNSLRLANSVELHVNAIKIGKYYVSQEEIRRDQLGTSLL
jgi:hypothetical protein